MRVWAVLDPAWAQAIIIISSAVAVALTAIVSYYFPRGATRFDQRNQTSDHDDTRDAEDDDAGVDEVSDIE